MLPFYPQVFSAMTMSFAHGSNDVANAVGPYAAIYYVFKNKKVPGSKTSVPQWIYVMGEYDCIVRNQWLGAVILILCGRWSWLRVGACYVWPPHHEGVRGQSS